ncbi:hypothetical protein FFI89_004155 [Bradyrhizobium sp. KBS0727]|uniref:hypothetical protein n=1 Tax=unclassified Bradyrhizobium TaxID=2631580 RepID=UPI00110E3CAF|nr:MULTISPECIES: hypothetical protein [unclassified Bradyrhizobium]QDW36408.1 hypothetical protein FFI71_004155 [Bradyrhizobium sp. KBS0725]QDW43008.1 hypothetical protein FFI89_004155 [Bradyrhizobium sp. KBS0727]
MKYALAVLMLLLPGIACAEETLTEKCTSDAASFYGGEGDREFFAYDVEVVAIEPKAHGSLVLWVKSAGGMSTRRHTCKQM